MVAGNRSLSRTRTTSSSTIPATDWAPVDEYDDPLDVFVDLTVYDERLPISSL